jgi:hypothetical protein
MVAESVQEALAPRIGPETGHPTSAKSEKSEIALWEFAFLSPALTRAFTTG